MLQNIRKNIQGTMAKIIVGLIVVTFALFGVESILSGGGSGQNAVEVNGEAITLRELELQINQQQRRLIAAMGDQLDPSMLDEQLLRGPALEQLVQKSLLLQAAEDYGLTVSDLRLGEIVSQIPAFQVNGRFDEQSYRQALSAQGYSPGIFKELLREDLIMTQVRAGLVGSDFVTGSDVDRFAMIAEQQRDLRYLVMPMEDFSVSAEVEDQAVEQWYQDNQDRFRTVETVELNYIELRIEDYHPSVDEAQVRELYELERASFKQPAEKAVSHILFEQAEGESEAALQARIKNVRALLDTEGADFSLLAKEHSDDIGSANFGGQLGYTSGESFPPEMEVAIAELELDEVSDPVRTDAGWHLMKVTEVRAEESLDFEQVRGELEARLRDEAAQRELVKKSEELKDRVFNAEDLKGPAAELELEVRQSGPVGRNGNEGIFSDRRLIAAAFSEEVLNQGYNSEVIEVEPNHFVVLRLSRHNLPEVRPLAEVRDEVVNALIDEQSRAAIRERAETLISRLASGDSIEEVALEYGYDWQVELGARRDNRSLPASMLARAFSLPAPATDDGTFEYVQNEDGDIELFQLVRVIEPDASALPVSRKMRLENQLLSHSSRSLDLQYQQELRASADIKIL